MQMKTANVSTNKQIIRVIHAIRGPQFFAD